MTLVGKNGIKKIINPVFEREKKYRAPSAIHYILAAVQRIIHLNYNNAYTLLITGRRNFFFSSYDLPAYIYLALFLEDTLARITRSALSIIFRARLRSAARGKRERERDSSRELRQRLLFQRVRDVIKEGSKKKKYKAKPFVSISRALGFRFE